MKKAILFLAVISSTISLNYAANEKNRRANGVYSPPLGPFYCQARCLASCVEMNLAASLDECTKFCPPFESVMPCPPNNAECWRTCGTAPPREQKPLPPAVNFVMAQYASSPDGRVQDPFTIELTWDPAPSASLYIVELYPLNREPKPGENNFFRAVTSFPTYTVRKEDECTIYDIRVMPVNANGIGAPQYTRIEAPRPTMDTSDFLVRNIQPDPTNGNFLIVTIDYAIPGAWPVGDVDLVGLRVKATDCRGFHARNNGSGSNNENGVWHPFYDALVEKVPRPTIRVAFMNEVLKSDCLFQMRVSALSTRCNTTTYFDSNGGATQDSTVGVDFRINCLTVEGGVCNEGRQAVPPVVVPADPSLLSPPVESVPIAPPVPSVTVSGNETIKAPIVQGTASIPAGKVPQAPTVDSAPEQGIASNNVNIPPLLLDYIAINTQFQVPFLCDIDTIDVQPSPSSLGPSATDLIVSWAERSAASPRLPSYFVVRYGPVVRDLVEDRRRPRRIMAGYENVVRTGMPPIFLQGPPERQLKIIGVPKGSLLSVQVCAVYDANIDPLILWDAVQSQYIDLVALEPMPSQSNSQNAAPPRESVTSIATLATDESPLTAMAGDAIRPAPSANRFVPFSPEVESTNGNSLRNEPADFVGDQAPPLVIQVGLVDSGLSTSKVWSMLAGGVFAALLMAIAVFAVTMRVWSKRADKEKKFKLSSFPAAPIATITKAPIQPTSDQEKDVEKVALP